MTATVSGAKPLTSSKSFCGRHEPKPESAYLYIHAFRQGKFELLTRPNAESVPDSRFMRLAHCFRIFIRRVMLIYLKIVDGRC